MPLELSALNLFYQLNYPVKLRFAQPPEKPAEASSTASTTTVATLYLVTVSTAGKGFDSNRMSFVLED